MDLYALQLRTLFGFFFFFLTFLDSSVTAESFVDETRVWRIYIKFSPGIYDEFIDNLLD